MRTAIFWVVTQRVVIISYLRFGTTYRWYFGVEGNKVLECVILTVRKSQILEP